MKVILTVTLICLCLSPASWALLNEKALKLYLTFDEGNGDTAKDQSGNNLEGKLQGAKWSGDGKIGGCLLLEDTEQFVEVDATPVLDITDAVTMEAWIFPEQSQGDSNLLGRRTAANQGGYVLQWSAQFTGKPQIETWISIGGWKGTRNIQKIAPKLKEWHHVASTYDGKIIKQYIDGKLDTELEPPNGKIDSVDVVFRVGKSQTGLPGMVGKVDEVAVYDRALTQDEITSDMNKGVFFAVEPAGKLATVWGRIKRE